MSRARAFRRRKHLRLVDWNRMILDLGCAGLTLCEISLLIGVPRSTLIGWKNGFHEPRYSSGVRLLVLWREKVEKQPSHSKTIVVEINQLELFYGPR